MNLQLFSSESLAGKIARLPLLLLPSGAVVPIVQGRLRGRRWIVGSAMHRCWMGLFESEKQRLISSIIQPDSVFYDVGANVGFYSLLGAVLVGATGRVFAFEPLPRNLAYLRRHLALNRAVNVDVLELAVGEQDGVGSFTDEATGCMGHLSEEGAISVPVARLDSLVDSGRLLPPNYIKMDIEGAELSALRGARSCIRQYRPLIFLATHGSQVHAACCHLLESWGYECTEFGHVTPDGFGEVVARPSRN
jgi:FkbM family methyltransferase